MGEQTSEATLRQPGQHARSRGLELGMRLVIVACAALLVLLAAWLVIGLKGLPLTLVGLTVIGVMLGANRWYTPQVDRWLQGAEGERAVATVLAQLEGNGWQALHDVSLGHGNVDHILVGPGGIYTIETKSNRGRLSIFGSIRRCSNRHTHRRSCSNALPASTSNHSLSSVRPTWWDPYQPNARE